MAMIDVCLDARSVCKSTIQEMKETGTQTDREILAIHLHALQNNAAAQQRGFQQLFFRRFGLDPLKLLSDCVHPAHMHVLLLAPLATLEAVAESPALRDQGVCPPDSSSPACPSRPRGRERVLSAE